MILLFDKNEQLIRMISKKAIRKAEHKQLITDESYLSNQLYAEILNIEDEVMKEVEYIAVPHPNDSFKYFFFWLKDYTTESNITVLQGVDSGIEELRKSPVYDVRPNNSELRPAVEQLLQGTNWTVGYVPDVGRRSTNAYYTDVFTALKHYANVWNVEFQLVVEVTNQGIGDRYIDFRKQLGKNSGARVVYGHNALEIIREINRSEIYTALIGRGKGEEVGETSGGDATYGRKINFEDVEWSKSKGDPVDKPLGQKYVEIPSLTQKYGVKRNGKMEPKIGFVEFGEEEDKENLLKQTYEALEQSSRPQVMMRTTAAYLDAEIGDKVRVARPDLGFDYYTRVFEVTYDVLTNKTTEIKLGDRLFESQGQRERRILSDTTSKINDSIPETIEKIVESMTTADGSNRIFQGEIDPRELNIKPRVNDLWFKPDPDYEEESILYIWNGEIWEEILRTAVKDYVERLIAELQEEVTASNLSIEQLRTEQTDRLNAFDESLKANVDQLNQHILSNEDSFSKITQTVNGIQTEIYDSNGSSKITQLSDLINQKVSAGDVQSIIRQSGDNIWLAIKQQATDEFSLDGKGEKILSEINLAPDYLEIKSSLIHLSGQSVIDSAVIKSSHIQSLTADKVNTGTLNAANVAITNLNVRSLVGFDSAFMRTKWNSALGGNVYIDGNGIQTKANNGDYAYIKGGGIWYTDLNGQDVGRIGISRMADDADKTSLAFLMDYGSGASFLKRTGADTYRSIMSIPPAANRVTFREPIWAHRYINTHTYYRVTNSNGWVAGMISSAGIGGLLLTTEIGGGRVVLATGPRDKYVTQLYTDSKGVHANNTLDMHAHSIINNSDIRLKNIIRKPERQYATKWVEGVDINFTEWKKGLAANEGAPDGERLTLIAQTAGIAATMNESTGYYSIDMGTQVNLNTLAHKENIERVKALEERVALLERKLNEARKQ